MTEEAFVELRNRVKRAEEIKRLIDELKKVEKNSKEIKIWGVCFYYDEECENRFYSDLPLADINYFIKEFVLKRIELLEREFAAL